MGIGRQIDGAMDHWGSATMVDVTWLCAQEEGKGGSFKCTASCLAIKSQGEKKKSHLSVHLTAIESMLSSLPQRMLILARLCVKMITLCTHGYPQSKPPRGPA